MPPTSSSARDAILGLLDQRAADATICPSEAARLIGGDDFREHMDAVRATAAALVGEGLIEVTQGGVPVDIGQARGPIRLRRAPR